MKASLFLSLCLLLAILAKITTASSSTTTSEFEVLKNLFDDDDRQNLIPINSGNDISTDSFGTTESGSTPDPNPSEEPGSGSTPDPSGTTESPGVSSQTTSTDSRDHCERRPCKGSASCVNLLFERLCLCPEGSYYQEPSCVKGKTFPGEIGVKVTETTGLDDKTSPAYQDLYRKVVNFFQKAFNENEARSDYGQTIILKVSASPSQSERSAMQAPSETIVYASVVNMFTESTTLNESIISDIITKAISDDTGMMDYAEQDTCDYYGCVKNDKGCQDPLKCTCKPGLTRPNLKVSFCLPLECPESCSAADRKQCLKNGNGPLECACMPGYQKSTGDKCEACPFGYSGQDCKDPFQLILTIVGTVAGALILILLIALIVSVSSKNKKRNVEDQKLIEEDLQNIRMQQTGFSNSGLSNSRFSNSGFSNNSDFSNSGFRNSGFNSSSNFSNYGAGNIFPKVRTGVSSQTQNPYANQRSMPRPDY